MQQYSASQRSILVPNGADVVRCNTQCLDIEIQGRTRHDGASLSITYDPHCTIRKMLTVCIQCHDLHCSAFMYMQDINIYRKLMELNRVVMKNDGGRSRPQKVIETVS
eukprot:jgi/Ulvmu1/11419/UM075_0081.1